MSNCPANFKQVDIARAVKGVQAGGCTVISVEITPEGRIKVICDDGEHLKTTNSMDKRLGL